MYAEKKHAMTKLFFDNLKEYTRGYREGRDPPPYFNHLAQIQIRLQFLSVIFSIQVSPVDFQLTQDQIHVLWECLANDPVCSDDFFQWLLVQARHSIVENFRTARSQSYDHESQRPRCKYLCTIH
jgi:ubiquitin carboxyl-terminal hydrolase 34